MSRSNAFEIKTKLSEEVHRDKRDMRQSKIIMIVFAVLFGVALSVLVVGLLMKFNKIPVDDDSTTTVLIIIGATLSVAFIIPVLIGLGRFLHYRHDYNWDLDAMEDGYKYVEDAMGRDEEAEEELEKRKAKRAAKNKKRG